MIQRELWMIPHCSRETLRSNVEVKVTDWLKAGINVNLSYQKYNTTTFGTEANSVYNKAYAAVFIVLTKQ